MTATPSQEWTANDERVVQQNARASDLGYGDEFVYRLSRAFLRLRAENERLMEWQSSVLGRLEVIPEFRDATWAGDKRGWGFVFEFVGWMHRELKSLRSQLAATREGETPFMPDEVRWEIYVAASGRCSQACETRDEAAGLIGNQRNPENFHLVRSTTSRSRVSDNG